MSGTVSGAALTAIGAFGWAWGSFLNMVVDRTPRRGSTDWRLGWFSPPRSICLACGADIAWYDNLPVLSYLLLRGRCRHCGAAIGLRTLAVELATPLLLLVLAIVFAESPRWPRFVWAATALSVGIVAVPTVLEGRRLYRVGWAGAVVVVAGVALWWIG